MLLGYIKKGVRFMSTIKSKFVDYKKGPPENLFLNERQITATEDEYVIKVKAIGINRAECLHRLGQYPILNEAEKNIGLEAAGQILDYKTGQKLFNGIALLSGGSYSQWVNVPKSHVMPLPSNLNFVQGAAIPQAWLTAYQLLNLAELKKGDRVALYAAASGVGTAAIQICNLLGYIPYAVVSSKEKGQLCLKLGAKGVVYYKENEVWSEELLKLNEGKQFDSVLDCVGPSNLKHTLKLLKLDGRWVLYGLLSGAKTEINFSDILRKRIKLISTTLKTRSKDYKDNLIENFTKQVLSEFQSQKVKPVISQVLQCDWTSAESFINAHKIMESNTNSGKIIIEFK